jgi:predicted  nucleic acid-binding Zn-ribbon protein
LPVAEKREITQEVIRARLEALRRELDRGHAELQKVKTQQKYLRETLLRIDGAVQVLEELAEGRSAEQNGVGPRGIRPASEPIGPTPGMP